MAARVTENQLREHFSNMDRNELVKEAVDLYQRVGRLSVDLVGKVEAVVEEDLNDGVAIEAAIELLANKIAIEFQDNSPFSSFSENAEHPFADLEKLQAYTHETFVEEQKAKGKHPIYLTFMSKMMLLATKKTEPNENVNRWLATALASVKKCVTPVWSWAWSWCIAIQFKAVAKSALIIDMLSGIIPGFPTAMTLHNRTEEFVKNTMQIELRMRAGCVAVLRYNNISLNYKPSPARAGVEYTADSKVATAMDVMYRGDTELEKVPNFCSIQSEKKHSPYNDMPLEDLLEQGTSVSGEWRWEQSSEVDAANGDELSEKEYFEQERKGYVKNRLTAILEDRKKSDRKSSTSSDDVLVPTQKKVKLNAPIEYKKCSICLNYFKPGLQICSYCKTPLETAEEIREASAASSDPHIHFNPRHQSKLFVFRP
jgi:hypothetical protein